MKALLGICFFLGLLSPGAPLQCHYCVGEQCETPKIQNCTDEQDACLATISEVRFGFSIMPSQRVIIKQCGATQNCLDNLFSISIGEGGGYRSNLQCCYTNLCNNMSVSLPQPVKLPPNGMQCPTCFSIGSSECTEVENLACTGNEMKCAEGAIKISTGAVEEDMDISFQGCATPNVCYIPLPKTGVSSRQIQFNIERLQCVKGYEDLTVSVEESKSLRSSASTIL